MDLAYCTLCGGSFIKDAETDTICGDCDPGEEAVLVINDGGEWGDIANELIWESGNAIDIDALEALRMSIEDQLPAEYWEREEIFGVTLTVEQAQMLDALQTKWAEQAGDEQRDEEPDSPRRRLGEIQEALEEVDRAIDKALRFHAYPAPGQEPLTADKAAETAEWVRRQQADYNTLIANALGELAGLVPEGGQS